MLRWIHMTEMAVGNRQRDTKYKPLLNKSGWIKLSHTSLVCVQESHKFFICLDSSRERNISAAFLYHEENFSSFFFMSGDVSATVFIKWLNTSAHILRTGDCWLLFDSAKLTFRWLGWYLNFSGRFMKHVYIIWMEKDRIKNALNFLVAWIYKTNFYWCILHAFAYVGVGHLKVMSEGCSCSQWKEFTISTSWLWCPHERPTVSVKLPLICMQYIKWCWNMCRDVKVIGIYHVT